MGYDSVGLVFLLLFLFIFFFFSPLQFFRLRSDEEIREKLALEPYLT